MNSKLIAFTGYAGAGKDAAAVPLTEAGYQRVCFGDIIKRQIDRLVREHFGFSALTTVREEKALIRRTLESWGEDNYDNIMREFFNSLPERAVNTRLVRVKEAKEWMRRGGVIVEVVRPGVSAATEWERDRMEELRKSGSIHATLDNSGDLEDLRREVLTGFELV